MKRLMVMVFAAPFAVEAARIVWQAGNAWFDAWFAAQLRKAWRPRPETRQ